MKYYKWKYLIIAWVGCCILLSALFIQNIHHQNKINKIFENYESKMKILHTN